LGGNKLIKLGREKVGKEKHVLTQLTMMHRDIDGVFRDQADRQI
jgi:hypothetical protein